MKLYLPKDEKILSWELESMDKYWQQCQLFDAYSSDYFIDSTVIDDKSRQAFKQLATQNGINQSRV